MALTDRDYMRMAGNFVRRRFVWAPVLILIAINIAIYFGQSLLDGTASGDFVLEYFALSMNALKRGFVWTLFTYSFLHGGVFHLFANMVALFFVRSFYGYHGGERRLLIVYSCGVLVGALIWLAMGVEVSLIGASAGVFAVLTYGLFCYYEHTIRFLLFFFIPLALRGKWALIGLFTITLGGFLFSELPDALGVDLRQLVFFDLPDAVGLDLQRYVAFAIPDADVIDGASRQTTAHSAHLGGMLAGAAAFGCATLLARRQASRHPARVLPFRQTVAVRPPPPRPASDNVTPFRAQSASAADLGQEVNRILDKINATGFASLTDAERRTLDHAGSLFR